MKNKILIFGFILLLAALPVLAAATIDFESPTYATGELAPQDGWFLRYGNAGCATVSNSAPISGSQSLSGTGNYLADRDIVTDFDKTSISMMVKISANSDTFIYLEDGYASTIVWMRMSVGGGMTCWSEPSGAKYVGAVNATDKYKITADYDFPNHTATVKIVNLTDGSNGSASLTLPLNDAGGYPITTSSAKKVGVYQWGNTSPDVVKYDDIKIYETPAPPPAGVIDFEYDAYTTGNLATQDGWIARTGASNLTVSTTNPLSGLQSASGTGVFNVDHNLITNDVCTLSMLVKFGADNDTMIYLKDRFLDTIAWFRLSAAGGFSCNTTPSGTIYVSPPLVAGNLYKLSVDFNFPNHTAFASIKNLSPDVFAGSDFEAPEYTTGAVDGQRGWIKHWGSYTDMEVSDIDPISGAQSLIGSPGDNVYKAMSTVVAVTEWGTALTLPTSLNSENITGTSEKRLGLAEWSSTTGVVKYDDIKVSATPSGFGTGSGGSGNYDKTTLSFLAKYDSGTDTFIYLTDRYVDTLNWIRIVGGTVGCWTSESGPQYMPVSLTEGDVYKIQVNYNFPNLTAVISLTDETTSTYIGAMTFKLPALSVNGQATTGSSEKYISLYNASTTGNVMFDDISITQSPNVATSTLTGSVFLFNYDYGDSTTVPVGVGLNGIPYYVNLDTLGNFKIYDVPNGTYDVRVKATHWLARGAFGVDVSANTDLGNFDLINGDVVDNNEVDFSDINAVRAAYGSFPGDETWNWRADVDGSGEVDFSDINIVRGNYGEIGD